MIALLLAVILAVGLPTNNWFGLRDNNVTNVGALGTCRLGGASASPGGRASVWSAVTGAASLDIIQVGATVTTSGRRYFAAWGSGEPGTGSYDEHDLGAADALPHKYTVQLIAGAWSLSIDGITRLRVPDTFRPWVIRAATASHETESLSDPFGGTAASPVHCSGARVRRGSAWVFPAWNVYGSGINAANAHSSSGLDWFKVWHD